MGCVVATSFTLAHRWLEAKSGFSGGTRNHGRSDSARYSLPVSVSNVASGGQANRAGV